VNYFLIFVWAIFLCISLPFAQNKKGSAPQPGTELIAIVDEHMPEVWKQFRSVSGGFSILFPGKPKEGSHTQTFQEQQFTTHMFQVLTPNAEYEVSYVQFPVRVDEPEKVEGALDGIRMDTVQKDKGQLLKESAVTVAGHPGRYISWRTEKGVIWHSKYFLSGYRVYMLSFGVVDENLPQDTHKFRDSLAAKFFDSFKLTKPSQS